jgi:Protein of unknown function (DUF3089)
MKVRSRMYRAALIPAVAAAAVLAGAALAGCGSAGSAGSAAPSGQAPDAAGTVWLCLPGMSGNPCTQSQATTVITATGGTSKVTPRPATSSRFDCFYVYGTVSTETSVNADLERQQAEIDAAIAVASPFSPLCEVYAPIYRQVTVADLEAHPTLDFGAAETVTAYDSIRSGFEAFLAHYRDGRPFIVIGDSQGAAMLDLLLARIVDDDAALRARLVAAIILGGNVEVPPGQVTGGTFAHIPLCEQAGQDGCVIAYSSFPSVPPAGALFGRPGQGVSLQSAQTQKSGLQVACVNPAALSAGGSSAGRAAALDSVFPTEGKLSTPWVAFPGLYTARCENTDGASWLDVTPTGAKGDPRPLPATEDLGPLYGYHVYDLPLAQDNLIADVAAAERTWTAAHPG